MTFGTEAKKHQRKIIIFTLVSLGVHLLVLFFVPLKLTPKTSSNDTQPLFVELDPKLVQKMIDDSKRQQIVNTEDSPNKQANPDAKYLSDKTQTTAEETKAKVVEQFKTGGKQGAPAQQALNFKSLAPKQNFSASTPFQDHNEEIKPEGDFQDKPHMPRPAQMQAGGTGGNANGSSNSDYLKNVKEGDRTVLNTKEFVYFGYYKRIRDSLEQAWRSKLHNTLEGYMYGGRQLASDHAYVTRLVVILDRHGRITSIQRVGDSGVRALDQAAVDAFNQAGPFPDPPSGLIEDNGQISIPWDFVLST